MLQDLLRTRSILLADGATGTNLFDLGLMSGDAPELWLDQYPERIADLHRRFVAAGADIILTNSFGANRRRLALHHLEARTVELNRRAAEIARRAAGEADRPVLVAGSVGPTGDLLAPLGPLSEDEAADVFAEQIEGLKAGGADIAWIETMSAAGEMRAAARAAARVGLPFSITASFDTAGRTMMGLAPDALAGTLMELAPMPAAIGANCGVGASDLVMSILAMSAAHPQAILIAKANCGVPRVAGDKVVYTGTPELMRDYVRLAADAGARIIGGCCGTTPAHLAAMRAALDAYAPGPRPDLASVTATLGPLVAPPSTSQPKPRRPRRG